MTDSRALAMPSIEHADLLDVVRCVTGDPGAEPGQWECTPLSYVEMNPVSGGVYRVRGTAGTGEWSVILKVLRHPRGGTQPTGEPVPDLWGEQPSHYNYWLREAEAFASGELDEVRGIVAPRVFGIVERSAGSRWLWLEDVESVDVDWSIDRYRCVARRLGLFNGSYVAGRPIPSGPWVTDAFLTTWLDGFAPFVAMMRDGTRADPLLARVCPREVVSRLGRLWDDRHTLCAVLATLPQCFAHLDAFGSNLLFRSEALDESPVIVDWAFAGRAAVGEEIVQLGVLTPFMLGIDTSEGRRIQHTVLDEYLAGLDDAGAVCNPDDVAFAYSAAAALRWGFGPYRWVAGALEHDDVAASLEAFFGLSFEQTLDHFAATQDWLLDEADRAYRLASERS